MAKIDLTGTEGDVLVEQADIKMVRGDQFDALVSVRLGTRTAIGHVVMDYEAFGALNGADHAQKAAAVRAKLVEELRAHCPPGKFHLVLREEQGAPTFSRPSAGSGAALGNLNNLL